LKGRLVELKRGTTGRFETITHSISSRWTGNALIFLLGIVYRSVDLTKPASSMSSRHSSREASPVSPKSIKQQAVQLSRAIFRHISLRMLVVLGSIVFGVIASLNTSMLNHFIFRGLLILCAVMGFKLAFVGSEGMALCEGFGMIMGCLSTTFFLMSATWPGFAFSILWAVGIAVLCRTLE
jgi:hypothetical protein